MSTVEAVAEDSVFRSVFFTLFLPPRQRPVSSQKDPCAWHRRGPIMSFELNGAIHSFTRKLIDLWTRGMC